MMATLNPAAAGSLASLRQALQLADRVASSFATTTVQRSLNRSEFSGVAHLSSVSTGDLEQLVALGQTVQVEIVLATWRLTLRRGKGAITESEGSVSEAVEQALIGDLEAAIQGRDFSGVLALLQDQSAAFSLSVTNDPVASGTHWIAGHADVQRAIHSNQWVPFARQLMSGPSGLLVDDLGDSILRSEAFTVYGPDAVNVGSLEGAGRQSAEASDLGFRSSQGQDGTPLPTPVVFFPLRSAGGATDARTDLVEVMFDGLAFLLAWALMSNSGTPIAGGIEVHVSGVRELDLTITPPLPAVGDRRAQVANLIDMYRWVSTSPEIDRLYFVQQALTLAILNEDDVHTAAGAALRNAKSLYELSRRNSVAEVMSSRRSAREIALAASRSAATQARDSSGKAVERTVALLAAAAGIVIARFQADMPASLAIGLLILVVAVCAASWAVTEHITIASADRGFTKELDDLRQYRDSLSEEDLEEIKNSGAIGAATSDLNRARTGARYIFGVGAAIALLGAIVVGCSAAGVFSSPKPAPVKPSNTTTVSPAPGSGPSSPSTTPRRSPSKPFSPSSPSRSTSKAP